MREFVMIMTATESGPNPTGIAEMSAHHEWPDGEHSIELRGPRVNVGLDERFISGLVGGAAMAYGLQKGRWPGYALAALGGLMMYRGLAGHCSMYQALGINTARQGRAQPVDFYERGIHVDESVFINVSPKTLFSYWRDFTNLPRIMSHLKSVTILDQNRSHWVVQGPLNTDIEWDASIIHEEPYELIAWRSLAGASVDNAGSVRFVRTGDHGTTVRIEIEYIPLAGRFGAAIAKLFGQDPGRQIREDLERFKQTMEAGSSPDVGFVPVGSGVGPRSVGMQVGDEGIGG
jgi:uncharacterized membrane protein